MKRERETHRALSGLIVLGLIVSNIAAAADSIDGAYTIDAALSDDIPAAIERSVAKLNFLIRPIARSRLKKINPAYRQIAIARAPGEVLVTFDARQPIRMPDNGAAIDWTREDGEKFKLKCDWRETSLIQIFVAEDGQRRNEFALMPDATMVLHVVLDSESLKESLRYKLVYRRATP